MTIEEAIERFEKQLTAAQAVLDSGFGQKPNESDLSYRIRKEMAEIALAALRSQQTPLDRRRWEGCERCTSGIPDKGYPHEFWVNDGAIYYHDAVFGWEARNALLMAFPGSFINSRDEFIAHLRTNQYIILQGCETPEDIEAKVLEWFSRPAHKTSPYSQEWRNRKFHQFMRAGINHFLDTEFTENDMAIIYQRLGNAINHNLTMQFISHDMDIEWLREVAP